MAVPIRASGTFISSGLMTVLRCSSRTVSTNSKPAHQQTKGNNWNYEAEMSALAVRFGHTIDSVPSLKAALSFDPMKISALSKLAARRNRFSLLGRSTMIHYVNEYLFFSYPWMDGSMLKDIGNSITCDDALAKIADHFGVTDIALNSSTHDVNVVSQALCGVVGAIFCDQGPKAAKRLVHDTVIAQLAGQDLEEVIKLQHPRLMLNTLLYHQGKPKTISRLISESGRATHFPSFVVGVFSGDTCLGEGTGTSIRRAETQAMITALRGHFQTELSATSLPSDLEEYAPEAEFYSHISVIDK